MEPQECTSRSTPKERQSQVYKPLNKDVLVNYEMEKLNIANGLFTENCSRKSKPSCHVCVLTGCFIMLFALLFVSVAYTYFAIQGLEERLEKKIEEKIVTTLSKEFGLNVSSLREALHPVTGEQPTNVAVQRSKRKAKGKREKKNRKKRARRRKNPVYVHMGGTDSSHIFDKDNNFIWQVEKSRAFGLNPHLVLGDSSNRPSKIKINQSGVYLVYSQVAVHGTNSTEPKDCSHQTIKNVNNKDTVILQSLLTQYLLGQPYDTNHNNRVMRALDTKLQMGVFYLERNTELRVKFTQDCDHYNYESNHKYSYFGVMKLGDLKR